MSSEYKKKKLIQKCFNQTVQTIYTPPYTCSIKQEFTFCMYEELVFDERIDRTNTIYLHRKLTLHNNEHW